MPAFKDNQRKIASHVEKQRTELIQRLIQSEMPDFLKAHNLSKLPKPDAAVTGQIKNPAAKGSYMALNQLICDEMTKIKDEKIDGILADRAQANADIGKDSNPVKSMKKLNDCDERLGKCVDKLKALEKMSKELNEVATKPVSDHNLSITRYAAEQALKQNPNAKLSTKTQKNMLGMNGNTFEKRWQAKANECHKTAEKKHNASSNPKNTVSAEAMRPRR